MGLADAVVAVAIHAVARVPIVQVHVGRALRAGPGAELGQVAGIARLSARNPRWLELQTHTASRAVLWLGQPCRAGADCSAAQPQLAAEGRAGIAQL